MFVNTSTVYTTLLLRALNQNQTKNHKTRTENKVISHTMKTDLSFETGQKLFFCSETEL